MLIVIGLLAVLVLIGMAGGGGRSHLYGPEDKNP